MHVIAAVAAHPNPSGLPGSNVLQQLVNGAAAFVGGACVTGAPAPQAEAFNPLKPVCAVGGLISGLVGKACTAVQHGGSIVSAGKKLATGHLGSAVKTIVGGGGSSIGSKAT